MGDSNDGFDDVVETDNSDNRPGVYRADVDLANESDGADRPKEYQTAKDRSPAWVKGQSRKRRSESLVETLSGKITTADRSNRVYHERGHYTESELESGGLTKFAVNQSSRVSRWMRASLSCRVSNGCQLRAVDTTELIRISSQLKRGLEAGITGERS